MQNVDPTTMTNEEAAAYLKEALNAYLTRLAEQVKAALEQLNETPDPDEDDEEELDSIFDDDDEDEDEDDDWDWDDDDEDEDEEDKPVLKFSVGDTVRCGSCGTRKIVRVEPDDAYGRFYYLDTTGLFANVGHFEADLTLVESAPKARWSVGDILECPACGKGKVLSIEENEGSFRYELEGIGKHYEAGLDKVEPTPEPAQVTPKFKEGDWVRGKLTGHYGRVVGMGEPFPFSSLPMYTVYVPSEDRTYDKYEGGLDLADMPAPKFQVGQRIVIDSYAGYTESHGVVTGVSIDEDNDYRIEFRMDDGRTDRLFDFQWGMSQSSITASWLIRLERDEVPF